MGGKGGGGKATDWQSEYTAKGYDPNYASTYAKMYPDVVAAGYDPYVHFYEYGQYEGRHWDKLEQPSVHMPSITPMLSQMARASAESAARYQKAVEEQKRAQGTANRDAAYAEYMDAASTATDYVNSQVNEERANAALLGIDYGMTDEIKAQRINDYFATLWGEGDQSTLESYMKEWGDPTGFTGFSVTRGDGSTTQTKDGSTTTVGVSTTDKSPRGRGNNTNATIDPLDEDNVLGV